MNYNSTTFAGIVHTIVLTFDHLSKYACTVSELEFKLHGNTFQQTDNIISESVLNVQCHENIHFSRQNLMTPIAYELFDYKVRYYFRCNMTILEVSENCSKKNKISILQQAC